MKERNSPGPDFIASQLRKPSGEFAKTISEKMDEVNEFSYDLILSSMNIKSGESLLEIGFGSGKYIYKLLKSAENLKVNGIDYSPEMVEVAMSNNEDALRSGQLKLQLGTSERLPFDEKIFDKVFCSMVIFFWDEPEKHLSEIRRVLKDKGQFYAGFRTKESMQALPFSGHGFHLYQPEEWRSILRENGLRPVQTWLSKDPVVDLDGDPFQLESIQLESICVRSDKI